MAEQAANVRMNAARFQRDEGVIERILKVSIAALDDPSQAAVFKTRWSKLERLFDGLTETFTQLSVDQTDLAATDTLNKRFIDAEDAYFRILEMQEQLFPIPKEKPTPASDRASPRSKARLPRIELPKFTGIITDWPAFDSVFASLVDTDPNLTNSDKLVYLITCVQGETHTLVSHLRATDDSYPLAMDILRRRYENPRMLADALIGRILNHPHVRTRMDGLRA